jgi:hypothetical protein
MTAKPGQKALKEFSTIGEEEFLRSAKPHLIAYNFDDEERVEFEINANVTERAWDDVIREGYDPIYSPLGCPVYWRVVNRGDEQFYLSTFQATRDLVIKGWGTRGLEYCDPVTGTAIARIETQLPKAIAACESTRQSVERLAPRADTIKEIWEVENWRKDEWVEQVFAEIVFSKAMNVQYFPDRKNLCGSVAGYRVRRAPNGLALVPSDSDENIFVAVRVERAKRQGRVLGWLRGSEGKLSQFYQKNRWIIPAEALHDMEELPGKEGLRALPPFQEPSP